jgi:hypothetical protein
MDSSAAILNHRCKEMKDAPHRCQTLYEGTDSFNHRIAWTADTDPTAVLHSWESSARIPLAPYAAGMKSEQKSQYPETLRVGFLYMILSLTCFGAIGLLVKFADLRRCRPGAVYSWAYAWCVAFSIVFVMWFRGGQFHVPPAVYGIAVPFGIMNAIGGIVFMSGVRFGKISTSWLIINLSAAIPAAGSVVLYHEPVNAKKLAVLGLAAAAVLLLWKDKQEDEKKRAEAERASEEMA